MERRSIMAKENGKVQGEKMSGINMIEMDR